MKIFKGFDEAGKIKNPVVTTGSFDGVHIGHKTILTRLNKLAEKHKGESVLITFDPHPRKVLYPETAGKDLKLINSQDEKLYLLQKAGLDNVIIVEFTREFSKITSEEFVREYLHGIMNAKVIVAGFNHHFGFNKEGDYKQLWSWREKFHFEAEEIPEQEVQHETVSSTKIRKAIREGYIQRANAYLDHYYMVMGFPVPYKNINSARLPDFVKVPLTEDCKILPATGIYAVSVLSGNLNSKGMALVHQEAGQKPELLVDVFDEESNFRNEKIQILFHKQIHGEALVSDPKTVSHLEHARVEISDLIY
jgi:riboflavin kinase/FMN adenylyltransferase